LPIYNPASATSNLTVSKNGTVIGTRPNINLIEGSQIALTVADDAPNTEVDVTIASSAGGSSAAGAVFNGTISTFGEGSVLADTIIYAGSAFNSAAVWPAANRAIFCTVQVLFPVTVYQLGWQNGATVGTNTVDVGIYNTAGTRLVSSGATTTSGVSLLQVVNTADTVLTADTYLLAMVMNGTTDTVTRVSPGFTLVRACGIQKQETASPLPSTATLVAPTDGYAPLIFAVFESATF
jgi:hypothetical protein